MPKPEQTILQIIEQLKKSADKYYWYGWSKIHYINRKRYVPKGMVTYFTRCMTIIDECLQITISLFYFKQRTDDKIDFKTDFFWYEFTIEDLLMKSNRKTLIDLEADKKDGQSLRILGGLFDKVKKLAHFTPKVTAKKPSAETYDMILKSLKK